MAQVPPWKFVLNPTKPQGTKEWFFFVYYWSLIFFKLAQRCHRTWMVQGQKEGIPDWQTDRQTDKEGLTLSPGWTQCSLMLLLAPGKRKVPGPSFYPGKLPKEKDSWTFRVHPGEAAISHTPRKGKRIPWSKESRAIIIWRDLGDSSKPLRNHIFKFISSIRRDRNCL